MLKDKFYFRPLRSIVRICLISFSTLYMQPYSFLAYVYSRVCAFKLAKQAVSFQAPRVWAFLWEWSESERWLSEEQESTRGWCRAIVKTSAILYSWGSNSTFFSILLWFNRRLDTWFSVVINMKYYSILVWASFELLRKISVFYIWEWYVNYVLINKGLNRCFYDRMRLVSMKKLWVLYELKKKTKNWTNISWIVQNDIRIRITKRYGHSVDRNNNEVGYYLNPFDQTGQLFVSCLAHCTRDN